MLKPLPRSVVIALPIVIGLCLMGSMAYALLEAQRELTMGEVQKIFYVHVPSAVACLLLFIGCALASLVFLVTRRKPSLTSLSAAFDRLAHACAEIGVLFGVVVLITGPIWAKPAWNTWWSWEPRLTLLLLTVFLFIGYVLLRSTKKNDERGKALSAGIALGSAPAVVIIHFAVQLWKDVNHPEVITGDGQGLQTDEMKLALLLGFVSICLLTAPYLVWMRMRHHRLGAEVENMWVEVSELEENP